MTTGTSRSLGFLARAALAGACVAVAAGCSTSDDPPAAPPAESVPPAPAAEAEPAVLEPVAFPELDGEAGSGTVIEQLREQYAGLTKTLGDPDAGPLERGRAYGEMGMLFLATEHASEAEACLRNARTLLPRDRRWPYYLGHLERARGAPERAVEHFEQARELRADDVPTLVWLAEMHLATGDPGAARPLLEYAQALEPDSLAVIFGLGRAAIAREDYFRAVQYLEEALALNPAAPPVLAALADAYGSLGEVGRAEANRQRQRLAERTLAHVEADPTIRPPDPLLEDLEGLVRTAAAYERRGGRALGQGNVSRAIAHFRAGLERQPGSASLRHKLGVALALAGNTQASRDQLEELLRRSPEHARAHYSLGIVMEQSGDFARALARYTSAVRYDPDYVEARLQLAGMLRRAGRPDDARAQYQRVIELDPAQFEGPFGYAMVLVTEGRWTQARDRLAEAMERFPNTPAFPLALARVLAAAPDRRARDGRRALEVMRRLPDEQQVMDLGETLAMALAEVGRYEEAADLQREAIAAAPEELQERMAANLELYEAGQPCRTPWREGEVP